MLLTNFRPPMVNDEQIANNLKARAEMSLCYNYPDSLRDFRKLWTESGKDWSTLSSMWNMCGGGCIICGSKVTSNNLEFFNFDVEVVRCYECQYGNRP